jgi:outer membrane receptor protein involved in Fe transport
MKTNNSFARVGLLALAALLLLVPSVLAQAPTGDLTGRVMADGKTLPGVTVTAASPSLQGSRVVVTGSNGAFKLAFLPPGEYQLTYELEGFSTAVQTVIVSAAQNKNLGDVELRVADVVEEVVITSALETVSEGISAETTYSIDEIEDLPVQRNIRSAALLTPGVSASGPKQGGSRAAALVISGAMSFESLYLVNGVVVNENIRGQALDLFIEDAIQEFTAVASGVSAEYGRFTGGVVNVLTKSGGNEFSGSLRRSYTQADWTKETEEFNETLADVRNEQDEVTLGGPFWKDHIWFFGAYRDIGDNVASFNTAAPVSISYDRTTTQERMEGKLTVAPHPSHSLVANYLEIKQTTVNTGFGNFYDLASLSTRTDPQDLTAGHYTGIIGPSFFVEAQYSERNFLLGAGSGSPNSDVIGGTVIEDRARNIRYHTGYFCGYCGGEDRNNENLLAKGSYFLTTENAGTHDLVFGYDTYTDIRRSDNRQSGSDFTVWHTQPAIIEGGNIFPVFTGAAGTAGRNDWILWWPIFQASKGTDLVTDSFYANDNWQFSDKLSFNLGLRYDANDGKDAEGKAVAKDDQISPRVGLAYDLKGDGDWVINASLGRYVAAIANTQADQTSAAGQPAVFISFYRGPAINTPGQPRVSQDEALRRVFDWYFANGGTRDINGDLSRIPFLFYASVPGGNTAILDNSLGSPYADEVSLGFTKRLGSKGVFRADLVFREYGDFYAQETSTRTGQVSLEFGDFDRTVIYNENDLLERSYKGLHINFRYRATDKLSFSGNYTLSQAEGNFVGETAGGGPGNGAPLNYPEYHEQSWNFPSGDLSVDQRHKANIWAIYDFLSSDHHDLTASLLMSYFSGTPYGTVLTIDPSPYVTNPGYLTPTTAENYFVTDRDAFHTDNILQFDASVNYSFKWNLWNRNFEVFLQPEILNIGDDQGVIAVNTTTVILQDFNPFTETPVEGVHFRKGPRFGLPNSPQDINQPRTYRFSVGFRF